MKQPKNVDAHLLCIQFLPLYLLVDNYMLFLSSHLQLPLHMSSVILSKNHLSFMITVSLPHMSKLFCRIVFLSLDIPSPSVVRHPGRIFIPFVIKNVFTL
jgi:hypothetical protein